MAAFASVHATYRVVTPMFLGDAEGAASCFSVASFRGMLRFWWRTRAYPRLLQAYNGDGARTLKELAAAEARLFGCAGGVDRGGQSLVLVSLIASELGTAIESGEVLNASGAGASTDCAADAEEDVVGPGARSRRGWGSLALVELTGTLAGQALTPWAPPETDDAYRDHLKELLPLPFIASTEPMPFTVFSAASRVEIVKHGTNAVPLLSELGDAFLRYRGWRRPAGEGNFVHDP